MSNGEISRSNAEFAAFVADGPPALFECRMRLWWADVDGEALSNEVGRFIQAAPYAIHTKYEGKKGTGTWRRIMDPQEELGWLTELARLLGRWLDGHRAALNYLIYQVALKALSEDPTLQINPEAVEFPIFNDAEVFKHNNRIKKFPQPYFGAIEDEQPYKGKNEGLWVLHELAREFRHRVVHPMLAELLGVPIRVTAGDEEITDVTPLYPSGPITHEVPVVEFVVPDSVTDYADVKPYVPVSISIDHPLCAERDCVSVINDVNAAVYGTMERLEALF